MAMSAPDPAPDGGDLGARPPTRLRWGQLFQISAFWFALNAIWGAFEIFQQKRTTQLVGDEAPLALGAMEFIALPIAILTMPVMGSISDYTTTRYGRRKPFVLFGSITAAVAIATKSGHATAEPWQLLLALLDTGGSTATALLRGVGANPADGRRASSRAACISSGSQMAALVCA